MTHCNLGLREIRQVYWLLGECTELGVDPKAWRMHLAGRLPDLICDGFANVVDSPYPSADPAIDPQQPLCFFAGGVMPIENQEIMTSFMRSPAEISPIIPRMLSTPEHQATRRRCEILDDRDWFRSEYFGDYVRGLGLNDQIFSVDKRSPHAISSMCLHSCGKHQFTERDTSVLQFLHQELVALIRLGRLAPFGGFSIHDLSPRQIEVLVGLFRGDTARQLARQLGISHHTVDHHVRVLHSRFGTNRRSDLLCRAARYYPVLRAWLDG